MANNLKSWTSLGAVVLTAAPQNLDALFPGLAEMTVSAIYFQAHEENTPYATQPPTAAGLVFIGDRTQLASGVNSARVLSGPLDDFRIENQGGMDTLDPTDFSLFSAPTGQRVRVGYQI